MSTYHSARLNNHAVLAILAIAMLPACSTPSLRSTDVRIPSVMVAPALLPAHSMSGVTYDWQVLSEIESADFLRSELPKLTDKNRNRNVDDVLFDAFGKRIIWVPRRLRTNDEVQTYEEALASLRYDGSTVGDLLRATINGSTMFGDPQLRWLSVSIDEIFQLDSDIVQTAPSMIDVVILTRDYIVFVAVPSE